MSLEEFLHNLQFDIDRANQPNLETDWEDAPYAYKLYRNQPVVPLSLEVPLTLEKIQPPTKPDIHRVGHFLWYVYGITQVSQSVFSTELSEEESYTMNSYRRFAPSGGALYPNELYIYLKIEGLPDGVYHYDPAHHRLVLLRAGNFDSYVSDALVNRSEISSCFGVAFVSTMFWKNYFKYNNFSYRLQGLDAGVLMGQLLETAKRFGFAAGVYFQYLDSAINHLLGLSEHEESVYSVIPLSVEPTNWSRSRDVNITAAELKLDLEPISCEYLERSQRILEFPRLIALNEASMLESTSSFNRIQSLQSGSFDGVKINLPECKPLAYDLAEASKNRFSPDIDFVMRKVSQQQLAVLLNESMSAFSYRNDLDDVRLNNESRVTIYGCLYNVEGIPDGAYHYDHTEHALREINKGDHRLTLQAGLSLDNVNLLQVPLCLHVVGNKDFYLNELGYRGYRILQMEAGMLVQSLLTTASAIGLGGHPLLGFDTNLADDIYSMREKTSLIQIPIGPYRPRPWLKGSLHS
ncbi:SagB/ThcOx family dehydrogenase [Mesobacillus boroniphilus]|uniref:SagB/ThcOx family dehydrogenase n=1 Tax=Mesobacillus boroniphilus TaxID=308892 RepID=A0A944GWV7_9BACI|nr:SagB family peptide dehydrogenase [Mesobacillus boroniphilus]MBS8263781.1 SagB/ThcOx family dehydrogenase [Mesobacillus boroniphilus]